MVTRHNFYDKPAKLRRHPWGSRDLTAEERLLLRRWRGKCSELGLQSWVEFSDQRAAMYVSTGDGNEWHCIYRGHVEDCLTYCEEWSP